MFNKCQALYFHTKKKLKFKKAESQIKLRACGCVMKKKGVIKLVLLRNQLQITAFKQNTQTRVRTS